MINKTSLRASGRRADTWSDYAVGGASAFLFSAIVADETILWAPAVVLGVVAFVLWLYAMIVGGR
jgi:hypothetical protein